MKIYKRKHIRAANEARDKLARKNLIKYQTGKEKSPIKGILKGSLIQNMPLTLFIAPSSKRIDEKKRAKSTLSGNLTRSNLVYRSTLTCRRDKRVPPHYLNHFRRFEDSNRIVRLIKQAIAQEKEQQKIKEIERRKMFKPQKLV